jgi:hypothetical protein
MLAKFRSRCPSPAMVVALMALFVALGGSSYAALTVTGRNVKNSSLTGKDVRNNSLTGRDVKNLVSGDVKNSSLLAKDFKPGQLPAGAQGVQGIQGVPGPVPDVFPSGKTARGAYAASGFATAGAQVFRDAQSFFYQLATEPTDTHFVADGSPAPPECPGTKELPQAQPGHLCVYEHVSQNATTLIDDPAGTTRQGFIIQTSSVAGGQVQSRGTWAVTAP